MQSTHRNRKSEIRNHWARAALLLVLAWNLSAAIPFVLRPADYAAGFELSGAPGEIAVRGMGLLLLMWAVPFVPALIHPVRYRVAFVCVLAMQVIGLAGESLMFIGLPAGHASLRATGLRFIAFDAAGLVVLSAAFLFTLYASRPAQDGAP
jgi:hypothetical protein